MTGRREGGRNQEIGPTVNFTATFEKLKERKQMNEQKINYLINPDTLKS